MGENYFGITDTGRLRDNNEDTFFVEKILNGNYIAACVIDGVGGYDGGEIAAEIARETILENLKNSHQDMLASMKDAILTANAKIYQERSKSKDHKNMSCVLTIAVVDVNDNQFHYAHIGDTRLYLLRDNTLVKVTKDHSFVGFLEDSKRLTEDEAMRHPKRNEINKALGFDINIENQADYIEIGTSPFLPSDLLLLCSDGLTDLVNSENITSIISSRKELEEKAQTLINAANEAGGKDNITVVLVQNDKKPISMKATKPALIKKKKEPESQKQFVEQKSESKTEVLSPKKSGKGAVIFLSILCLVLAAALVWMWMQKQQKEIQTNIPLIQKSKDPDEQRFLDHLESDSAGIIVFSDSLFQNGVTISDTIRIQKDSLYINGNGITVRGDSSFRGAAWIISPHIKYLVLENFSFENFNIGILSPPGILHLKNVSFPGTHFGVLNTMNVSPDSSSIQSNRDSLAKRKLFNLP